VSTINEPEVVTRFQIYLEDANIHTAVSMIVDDCDGFSEEEIEYVIDDILIPSVVCRFAEHYNGIARLHNSDPNPISVFETFCTFEGIADTNLANAIATAINEGAANDADNDDDGDPDNSDWDSDNWGHGTVDDKGEIDDQEVVFKREDWGKLSDEDRIKKVKLFLKKLSRVGNDAKNMRPFLKNLNVGDKENYLGVKYGDATKPFSRKANHYGHSPNESFLRFPGLYHHGNDSNHENHPLHATLKKYGYSYSHSVNSDNGDTSHIWKNILGHQIEAFHNDTKWSSKVSHTSPQTWTGIGVRALRDHLANRAKRYRIQNDPYWGSIRHNQDNEETQLPQNQLQEGLLDQAGYERVRQYAKYLNANPIKAFGIEGASYDVESPVKAMKETHVLREKQEKLFGQGKDRSEWSIFDARSGKPK